MTDSAGFLPLSVPVEIAVPDIRRWIDGNTGIPGVWSFAAAEDGPHLAVTALVHGNEIGGAHVLDRWLRAGIRPARGRLSLAFCNLAAFRRFDPDDPTATRFVDEDLNRCWSDADLGMRRISSELRRARELRPLLDTVDVLVDLHSMLWPSDPLILAGETEKAARLAVAIGVPPTIVSDSGHAGGRRMIDYARFADPATDATAVLVEAGPHWQLSTVARMDLAAARALRHQGMARPGDALPADPPSLPAPRRAVVTRTITAASRDFAFVREFRGGEVIPARNTLIALDGEEEIRTPHDDCLLVMPTPMVPRGHTAVRLARLLD
ncbi:succinylglutamate desuccinylase/aspartoacylase family protein [Roseomonas sp. PWR1]|uniref:Succinylglutamate desuccinylase/aspartoacylase family protein n=1 Tax=Roseomonas nitratireducens TaxID=2820810 RepID=A0ABS4AZN1_9PROT|nr:succinylglutamate desuccinylase/aspartoacylase family protein [Neoroseomonas nitratireducens]MBP0466804.1 succinylglutamate desuccinylase/aspartoacylase family protein [Neoroseomonas nitratireducens]